MTVYMYIIFFFIANHLVDDVRLDKVDCKRIYILCLARWSINDTKKINLVLSFQQPTSWEVTARSCWKRLVHKCQWSWPSETCYLWCSRPKILPWDKDEWVIFESCRIEKLRNIHAKCCLHTRSNTFKYWFKVLPFCIFLLFYFLFLITLYNFLKNIIFL